MNDQNSAFLVAYWLAERDEAILFVAVGLLAVVGTAWIVRALPGAAAARHPRRL